MELALHNYDLITIPGLDHLRITWDNVIFHDSSINISLFNMIFILRSTDKEPNEIWILFSNVDCVNKQVSDKSVSVILKLKNFRTIEIFTNDTIKGSLLADTIENVSLSENTTFYPFYHVSTNNAENLPEIFKINNVIAQYLSRVRTRCWRISDINTGFKLCESYPEKNIVPSEVPDDIIAESAKFRKYHRFPVLSCFHLSRATCLVRCSKPKFDSTRNKSDEAYFKVLRPRKNKGYMIDLRPFNKISSFQLLSSNDDDSKPSIYYALWKTVGKNMFGVRALQEVFSRFVEATVSAANNDRWFSRFASWNEVIRNALSVSKSIVNMLENECTNVIIQEETGCDNCLLVSSLVQLIIDANCRSFDGFISLIIREWISAGHPFHSRCAHSAFSKSTKDVSPYFLVFLECAWQLTQQHPTFFEFNEQFLILLFEHSYSSCYGTFLFNSESERKMNNVESKTFSLWGYVIQPNVKEQFINPVYESEDKILDVCTWPMSLECWRGLYLRFYGYTNNDSDVWKMLADLKAEERMLEKGLLEQSKDVVNSN